MKTIKNILYISVFGLLAACSDDIKSPVAEQEGDYLTLDIEVPEEILVESRAVANHEGDLMNLDVYIFNSDGTTLLQHESVTGSSKTILINDKVKEEKNSNRLVYVVANASGMPSNPANVTEIRNAEVNASNGAVPSGKDDYFVMSGSGILGAKSSYINVYITRLAAKISVLQGTGVQGFTIEGFEVHNPASKAYVGAPENQSTNKFGVNSNYTVESAGIAENNPVYVYPSQSAEGADLSKAYVIVKAKNNSTGNSSFYRLNLINNINNNNNNTPLHIQPNHYIKITINNIKGEGYANASEAANHPELQGTAVEADIHDHAPGVYSMISDGIRELGTPDEIIWTTGNSQTFTVKWYSGNSTDMTEKPKIEQLTGKSWVVCSYVENSETSTGDNDYYNSDKDHAGYKRTYRLDFVEGAPAWNTSAQFKVSWKGLERIIKVNYNIVFDPQTVLSISKAVFGGVTIDNYWNFLNQTGSPVAYGARAADMGDNKDRSNGFHFPMYYDGGKDYSYELTFNETKFNNEITNVTATVTKAEDPLNNVSWTINNDKKSGTLSWEYDSDNKYTYATGTITFTIYYKKNQNDVTSTDISFPIYHTGFFWPDGADNYLYYEVVPMGGKFWLDRNIGAKSCMNYVEYSSATDFAGNKNSKGTLYAIGEAHPYGSPTIDHSMCPTGFHVPNKTEFDAVRTSSAFVTEQVTEGSTLVYATFYKTSGKMGNIYFPKSKYENGTNPMGDDASGYYWSSSESSGLEKDQKGCWVNALYMSGASNTWINGEVGENKHKMSVRAIAGTPAEAVETKKTISLNVQGATHVYIYDKDPGNGLFTFPGKAVCTPEAANKKTKTNFSYTVTKDPSNFKVYLVNVAADGKITVYSDNRETKASTATGIDYVQGATYSVSDNKTVKDK